MMVLWSSAAMAAIVNQEYRVWHRTDLEDVDGTGGEDYFVTNTTYLARFAFVYLYDTTGSNNFPVAYGHTDANGRITFNGLDTNKDYTLQLWSAHVINGRSLSVRDANDDYFTVSAPERSPVGGGILLDQVYYATTPGQEWINVAAVASWTIHRRQSSFKTYASNGAIYTLKLDDPSNCPVPPPGTPPTGNAVYCWPDQSVYLYPGSPEANSKYTIAHELGHALQHWALVPTSSSDPDLWMYRSKYDAVSDVAACSDEGSNHKFNSFEYQSAAITEGFAHYVAAVAFNVTTEGDCRFDPNTALTWHPQVGSTDEQFSCEGWDPILEEGDNGGVESQPLFDVPGGNFFDFDPPGLANEPCSANTDTANRGIELDWLRFFWDVDNKENLDTSDLVDIWVEAEPFDWDPGTCTPLGDCPQQRMYLAFDLLFASAWDNQADYNGVDF